jgi:hypothetical protein
LATITFGQYGPKYFIDISQQTICRKLRLLKKKYYTNKSHILFFLIFLFYYYNFSENISACIITYFLNIVIVLAIYLVLVKILFYTYNPQITKARILNIYKSNITLNSGLSMLVGISEAIRLLFFNCSFFYYKYTFFLINFLSTYNFFFKTDINYICYIKKIINNNFIRNYANKSANFNSSNNIFNQWLAGLIDGDGCFQLSKKGYVSLEITMDTRDKHCLYLIKQKFGGSIKLRSGVKAVRYRLHHKQGMINLINAVNGEIRNPVRLLQFNKICDKYNIKLILPSILTYNNGWLSGFFDSDGSVYLILSIFQMCISAGQKNNYILNLLPDLYGGTVYTQKDSFKWVVRTKPEIIKLLDYFKLCPSRSAKHNRLKAIKKYYELKELKAHLATDNSILSKAWKKFLLKWNKWEKVGK